MIKIFHTLLATGLVLTFGLFLADITQESRKILGADIPGYKLRIEEDKSLIDNLWADFAKGYGKPEKLKGYLAYETNPWKDGEDIYILYHESVKRPGHTALWLGLDPEKIKREHYESKAEKVKDILEDFSRYVQVYKIQKAIDEAEQATAYLSKHYDALKKDERNTAKNQELNLQRLEKYKKDVITLQNDSAKYFNRMIELEQSIDSVYKEMEQLKKILEMQRERLKGVQ